MEAPPVTGFLEPFTSEGAFPFWEEGVLSPPWEGVWGSGGVWGLPGSEGSSGLLGAEGSDGPEGSLGVLGFDGSEGSEGLLGSEGVLEDSPPPWFSVNSSQFKLSTLPVNRIFISCSPTVRFT